MSQTEKDQYSTLYDISAVKAVSRVHLFATPWTVQPMEFSRPEYWSGLPFPSPGGLPDRGIEPWSPALQADALLSEPPGKPLPLQDLHVEDAYKEYEIKGGRLD